MIVGDVRPYKAKLEKLFSLAGEILEQDFSKVVVSVNFVSKDEIQKLNKKYRLIDKPTDVLSFPNLDIKAGEKLSAFSSEVVDGELFLGDVVICKEIAEAQAKEYGHSEEREVCFLALHSLLHLLGYDHMEKEDEMLMKSQTEKILTAFGVSR